MSEAVAAPLVAVREAGQDAWPFAYSNWLHSYKNEARFRGVPSGVYWKQEPAACTRALEHGKLLLVTPPDEPKLYLAFAVLEGATLHYAWVKEPFRRRGLCALLLGSLPQAFTYTRNTDDWRRVARSRPLATFNPYLAGGAQ